MAVVLQPGGKTKQFRTNEKDTIRYMSGVRDTFYFLCSDCLEFSLCSNLGYVYIYWKKALSVAFFKWWHQINLVLSNNTLERWINLTSFFLFLWVFFFVFFLGNIHKLCLSLLEVRREVTFFKSTTILLQINR